MPEKIPIAYDVKSMLLGSVSAGVLCVTSRSGLKDGVRQPFSHPERDGLGLDAAVVPLLALSVTREGRTGAPHGIAQIRA